MTIILVTFHDCSSFLVFVVSDHFSTDPAATPFNATRPQHLTLWRFICVDERAKFIESLMNSKYCFCIIHVRLLASVHCLLGRIHGRMMCWDVFNVRNKVHCVFCLGLLEPLRPVATKGRVVSREEGPVESWPTKRRKSGGRMKWAVSCDWSDGHSSQVQLFFRPHLSEGSVSAYASASQILRHFQDSKHFLATTVLNLKLQAGAYLSTKRAPWRKTRLIVNENRFWGSTGGMRHRKAIRRTSHRGQYWCSGCHPPSACEGVRAAGTMNFSTSSGPTSLSFPGKLTWTWRGLAMMFWLVFYSFHVLRNCSCWTIVVLLQSIILTRHVPTYPQQNFHLGENSWLIWCRHRGASWAHLSLHSVLRQKPVSSSLSRHAEPFQQQCESRSDRVGANHWRHWSRCSCGLSGRWSTCNFWGVCFVSC